MERFRIKDAALRKRAEEELGETDEIRTASLDQLKKLIQGEPRICGEVKDELLLAYLRTTKFNVNDAYTRVRKLAQLLMHHLPRKWISEYGQKEKILQSTQQTWFICPEGYDQQSRKVMTILGGSRWDPDKMPLGEFILSYLYIVLAEALDERSQVGGFVIILDSENTGLRQVVEFTPSFLYVFACLFKDCLPIRIKEFHLSKLPLISRGLSKFFLSLVGEKIRGRFHIYGSDFSAEKSRLPLHLLPVEFGGTCPNVTQSSHVRNILIQAENLGVFQSIRELSFV